MEPPAIRRRGAEDLISGLPNEILHIILSRLPSAADAARTSVLSRHWRGVWALMPMPDLVFDGSSAPATPPSALLDSIDAALKLPAAPTFRSLKIDLSGVNRSDLPAHRISTWLRFASQRVAGKLSLRLHLRNDAQSYEDDIKELALPIYERATEIDLRIMSCTNLNLRLPPTGSFSLLTDLIIACFQVDGGEMGRLVSSPQCPRLRNLHLLVWEFKPVRDISISSESLQCLHFASRTSKLEVTAPMLREISVYLATESCIVVAPKLEKIVWHDTYDPGRHQFAVAGRHLHLLSIKHSTYSSTRLMERFDTVSQLTVSLTLEEGIAGYTAFSKEMDKLPICESLDVLLTTNHHANAVGPVTLHLLKRCNCIRKFTLILNPCTPSEMSSCTASDCPCHLPENYRLDDITFDSLEEIGINFSTGSAKQVEFVELLLSRCNTVLLKRVDFTVPSGPASSEIMEVVQRIRSMCHPKIKVRFDVNCREVSKP